MSLEVENNLIRVNNQLCDFSKDGRFFATAYQTNLTIKGYKKLDTIHSFVFPDIIEYLEWSRNTEYILCANIKKAIIQVYSIRYPEWKYKLIEGSAGLESVSWSPDSKYILTLSDFNIQISVWSLDDQSVTHIQNMKSSFHKLYFSPDGNKLAVVVSIEGNDNIEIYKTDTWKLSKRRSKINYLFEYIRKRYCSILSYTNCKFISSGMCKLYVFERNRKCNVDAQWTVISRNRI